MFGRDAPRQLVAARGSASIASRFHGAPTCASDSGQPSNPGLRGKCPRAAVVSKFLFTTPQPQQCGREMMKKRFFVRFRNDRCRP